MKKMVRETRKSPAPQVPTLTPDQVRNATAALSRRLSEVDALDPATVEKYSPKVAALQSKIDDTLARTFGAGTERYERYRRTLNWAEDIPSFGGGTSLEQYRNDVAKGKSEVVAMLTAAIESLDDELISFGPTEAKVSSSPGTALGNVIFIGHGRSELWRVLKDFLKDRLHLSVDEFNNVPTAGVPTAERLREMLKHAGFAFLVMTAEDDQPDGKKRARENVVHEVGLFQGKLGFERAIVLLEQGCEEFSNIHGLGQIRFPKGNISACFEEVRRVLEREKLI